MFSFHKNLKMSSYMNFLIHILWKENVFDHRLNMNDNIIMREINLGQYMYFICVHCEMAPTASL